MRAPEPRWCIYHERTQFFDSSVNFVSFLCSPFTLLERGNINFNNDLTLSKFLDFVSFLQAAVQQKKLKETQSESTLHQLRQQKPYNIVKDDLLSAPENTSLTTLPPNESALFALTQPQTTSTVTKAAIATPEGPKRLHVTNLPFKVRDPELRNMFAVRSIMIIMLSP